MDGPSPFPFICVGHFEGMGGIGGTSRDAYGVREFSQKFGRGSNVGMLTPMRVATSSYAMVLSILLKLVIGGLFTAKRVSGPLCYDRVLRWGRDLSKLGDT